MIKSGSVALNITCWSGIALTVLFYKSFVCIEYICFYVVPTTLLVNLVHVP